MSVAIHPPVPSLFQRVRGNRKVRRFFSHRTAVAALVCVLLFIAMALFAPFIAPYDPIKPDYMAIRAAPSAQHLMGADELGRDLFSRIVWGARTSLLAGIIPVMIALSVSLPLGLVAGFVGGWIDALVMRFTDAMLACPFLIIAIALAAFLGPSLRNAMIAIGIASMPTFLRLVRSIVVSLKQEDYVEAARAVGNSPARICLRHILPNMLPPLLIQASITMAASIIAEASMSFLGLGQQPPAPSWGSMLNSAQRFMVEAPWMALWPGVMIFLVVMAFNVLGDGLRDVFQPKHK
jgi:peptide/nickel transport system permease protein